jgi:Flp pilus assembly protein TadG
MLRRSSRTRAGVAAVEVAVITAFFLVPLLLGVWEVGRLVQVQQIVSNSARAGARLAAQGYTINSSGSTTQVMVTPPAPDVTDAVYQYLLAAGLTNLQPSDVTVQFQFLPPNSNGATQPYQGVKGQPFTVTVTIPWNKVQWFSVGLVNPSTVTYVVYWQMLVDDPFTVDSTLPTW